MSNIGRAFRGVPGGSAVALAASAATFAMVLGANVVGIRLGETRPFISIVSKLAFVAPPDGTWSASWEPLSGPAAAGPRAALTQLVRTSSQMVVTVLIIAALALVLHSVSRALGQWRSITIRLALGTPFRNLLAHAAGGLCAWGVVGCGAGFLAGSAAVLVLKAGWPAILEPKESLFSVLGLVAIGSSVVLMLAGVTYSLLQIVQRAVRLVSDLHGDHVTTGGPLLLAQSVLAVTQLSGLLVAVYAIVLIIASGVPTVPSSALQRYPDSLTITPLAWTGEDAGDLRARAAATAAIVQRAESAGLHVAVDSPDAWPGVGKSLELVSVRGGCAINAVKILVANVRVIAVGPGALTRMAVTINRGRDVEPRDSLGAPRVAILNSVAADRLFTRGDPLHQAVTASSRIQDCYEVIGVARSIMARGLGTGSAEPIVYVSALQTPPVFAEITAPTAETDSLRTLASSVSRRGLRARLGTPFALGDRLRDYEAPLDWFARLMTALGVVAALVATTGLVALMRQLVALREREIAVRMALGARPVQILRWVAARALWIAFAGAAIGLPLARWMGFVMREHLNGPETDDLASLALLAAAIAALAILSSVGAAMRAVRVSPSAAWSAPTS